MAVDMLTDCEVVVFLTQDAVLATPDSLEKLLACFDESTVAVAYGRQLPRTGAGAMEAHARLFNYGDASQQKNLAARSALGAKVFFCSNSFAAYRRSTLLKLGGFRSDLILGEDAEYAARAVLAGYTNVYCAEAAAFHSHDYSVGEVFRRYFDTGVFHARNSWMRERFGAHGGEGLRFLASELKYVATSAPSQIPRSLCHNVAKAVGYRLGCTEKILPLGLKRLLSMNAGYWRLRRS